MDYPSFHRRIAGHFDRLLAHEPRGTKKDLCARAGVGPCWLSDFRRGKTTSLRPLVTMLHNLRIHPGEFIYEATREEIEHGVGPTTCSATGSKRPREEAAPACRGQQLEMQAELLADSGRYDRAAERYRLALEHYLAHDGWLRAAVVTLRLCIVLRLAGQTPAALEIAKDSLALHGHLQSHLAKRTITILALEARVSRRLELDLLDRLLADLLKAVGDSPEKNLHGS